MSSTVRKNGSGRIYMNVVAEQLDYLKSSNPKVAEAFNKIGYKILCFIRDHIEDEDSQHLTIRQASRHNAEKFLATLDDSEKVSVQDAVLQLFLSIAYERKMEEANRRIEELEEELNDAKSVFTVRQVLEHAVNGEKTDRGHRFAFLLMDTRALQKIFDTKFENLWFKRKPVRRMCLAEKANMAYTLYEECYENDKEKEIHWPPGSVPCYGMVVKVENYTKLQQTFLKVVAEFMRKNFVVV